MTKSAFMKFTHQEMCEVADNLNVPRVQKKSALLLKILDSDGGKEARLSSKFATLDADRKLKFVNKTVLKLYENGVTANKAEATKVASRNEPTKEKQRKKKEQLETRDNARRRRIRRQRWPRT